MEKQKRWHLYLILGVVLLTVYNILPTIFFYTKPLKEPVSKSEVHQIASGIVDRVNSLEGFTVSWLKAQSKNLGLKPVQIELDPADARLAKVSFDSTEDAAFFAQTLYRAGALIPFVPAQLTPSPSSFDEQSKIVVVQRRIGVHLDPEKVNSYFSFVPKTTESGEVSPEYQAIVADRAAQIALGFGGESEPAKILLEKKSSDESIIRLARSIVEYETAFGEKSPITQRYFASFTQSADKGSRKDLLLKFTAKLDGVAKKLGVEIADLKKKSEGDFLSSVERQKLEVFENQKNALDSASSIVRRNTALFEKGATPLSEEQMKRDLEKPAEAITYLKLGERNPFVSQLAINWSKDTIDIELHEDVVQLRAQEASSEKVAIEQEKLTQLIFNEVAAVSRKSSETIAPGLSNFVVSLNTLTNSTSLLTLDLSRVAEMQVDTLETLLKENWKPTSELADFSISQNELDEKLGLVLLSPAAHKAGDEFRPGSIYVVAKGLFAVREKYDNLPASEQKSAFEQDFANLQTILRQNGFIAYPGSALSESYRNDYIFELDDFYAYLLAATREDFSVRGSKNIAVLEMTDNEQRLLTLNKIESEIHEDLIKWRDEYKTAKVSLVEGTKYDVPKPTQNVLLDNLRLSTVKYFRGDERKVLKWGLDLSGGKTVRIGLRDQNNQAITDEADLKQATGELYSRVNRLGLSEVSIRTEGSNIVLDFPGSQGLSANELIQASAMQFHVVNEKFSPNNPMLAEAVGTFLEEVYNEAVITDRTDPKSLNEIAFLHLGGDPANPNEFQPLTSHAQLLYEHGLRFGGPKEAGATNAFDDSLSAISLFRGADYTDWQGQTNPLVIIFRNYALEGANLANVQTGYDSSEGNILNFTVKSSYVNRAGEKVNPRDDFYAWTSQFSEEKIAGSSKEAYSKGRGWRMAVILNGSIINAPTLNAALRDSARISGNFSQREVTQLAADLKAGSLSFTPHILSEENVSPDLGKEQRAQGVFAALLGIVLVVALMCSYYRFGGLVASGAVLFNLLIMWGVLQNLGAALTLPGIAGIILAIGMSVDANVLIFERIREEFAKSGRLPSAVAAGYKKAFSAIVDSNLTTILAALILLNFDSGPIKGLALTLIIGIVSSMFTALFVTRYFFAGWVQNPKHKELKMAHLFGGTKINFLGKARVAFVVTGIFILLSGFFLVKENKTLFGMDFTGGYALTVDLAPQDQTNYRLLAIDALEEAGASPSDFQIQELGKPTQLRIQLGTSLEQTGKPYYGMAVRTDEKTLYAYQQNPRIVWIVDALEARGLQVSEASLPQLSLNWTQMSGQLSDTMRNQALLGLGLALACILVYITFRFEFKYAVSATIALAHDLVITLGCLALLHMLLGSVQIDMQVIAAMMTIVGYSLNDTIVIFDRIRENLTLHRKLPFGELVNKSLNETLSRTVMTSATTVIVLLALVFFGGPSIFNFALIMTLGVLIGTFSSLFIASPLLLYFHRKEDVKESGTTTPNKV